jgi:hypothetical protein
MASRDNYWDYWNLPEFKIEDMLGKTFVSVTNDDGKRVIFTADNGDKYVFCHIQDCCEGVEVKDIVGDLSDLTGSPLLEAEENSNSGSTDWGSETWTFYKFGTIKGHVNISWLGESNGYYSESVDRLLVKENSNENP